MSNLEAKARALRKEGMTYAEISKSLRQQIPKSTLSYWCRDIKLGMEYDKKIASLVQQNLMRARERSVVVRAKKEEEKLQQLLKQNLHLAKKMQDRDVSKIALAILYLGEGGKRWRSGCLYLGNSDEKIIKLYLKLLNKCYDLDQSKFRCTVQCRADQDSESLKLYWSEITQIPLQQFYKTQVDKRTTGKPTQRYKYRGVCRIDYLSVELFKDIMQSIKVITDGPLA